MIDKRFLKTKNEDNNAHLICEPVYLSSGLPCVPTGVNRPFYMLRVMDKKSTDDYGDRDSIRIELFYNFNVYASF